MNNIKNIEIEVLKIFTEKQKYDKKYNNILYDFITKAYRLVDLSEDLYQIEHTIKLNKISLKDYILNSDICNVLKENNINDYSIEELKDYMNKYERQNLSGIFPYRLALELYEELEKLERCENDKIEYEVSELSNIFDNIKNVRTLNKESFKELYSKILLELKEKYLDDKTIDDKTYNYIVQILNDIFNYYIYGNKEILFENNNT